MPGSGFSLEIAFTGAATPGEYAKAKSLFEVIWFRGNNLNLARFISIYENLMLLYLSNVQFYVFFISDYNMYTNEPIIKTNMIYEL